MMWDVQLVKALQVEWYSKVMALITDDPSRFERRNRFNQTLLSWAVIHGKTDFLKLLTRHIHFKFSLSTVEAVLDAVNLEETEMLKILLSKHDRAIFIDDQLLYGETALRIAVLNNDVDSVRILLDHDSDPNHVHSFDLQTPLSIAIDTRKKEIITLIVCHEKFKFMNQTGKAVLSAVNTSQIDVVRLLLSKKTDISISLDQHDVNGKTALRSAVVTGDADMVKLLLDHGADANHESSLDGMTVLSCSVQKYNMPLVRMIVEHEKFSFSLEALSIACSWLEDDKLSQAEFILMHAKETDILSGSQKRKSENQLKRTMLRVAEDNREEAIRVLVDFCEEHGEKHLLHSLLMCAIMRKMPALISEFIRCDNLEMSQSERDTIKMKLSENDCDGIYSLFFIDNSVQVDDLQLPQKLYETAEVGSQVELFVKTKDAIHCTSTAKTCFLLRRFMNAELTHSNERFIDAQTQTHSSDILPRKDGFAQTESSGVSKNTTPRSSFDQMKLENISALKIQT